MFGKKITNIILILSLGVFLFGSGYKLGEYKTNVSSIRSLKKNVFNSLNKTVTDGKNLDFNLFAGNVYYKFL